MSNASRNSSESQEASHQWVSVRHSLENRLCTLTKSHLWHVGRIGKDESAYSEKGTVAMMIRKHVTLRNLSDSIIEEGIDETIERGMARIQEEQTATAIQLVNAMPFFRD